MDRTQQRLYQKFQELDPNNTDPYVAPEPEHVDVPQVHQRAVDLLDELFQLAISSKPDGHAGMLLNMLRRSKPMLLKDFAKVPEPQVNAFLSMLSLRLLDCTDAAQVSELITEFGKRVAGANPALWAQFVDEQRATPAEQHAAGA